jgi:hypothetical protein
MPTAEDIDENFEEDDNQGDDDEESEEEVREIKRRKIAGKLHGRRRCNC